MFFRVKLKNLMFSRRLFFFFLVGILFSVLLYYYKEKSESFTAVKVKITDADKSDHSKRVIEGLIKLKEVHFSDDADLIYEFKESFGENFKKGELDDILRIKKGSSHIAIRLMNDKIGSEIIRQFIYFDMYQRLNKVKSLPFHRYEESLEKSKNTNEILTLSVISLESDSKREEGENDFSRYFLYIQFFLITLMGIALHSFSFVSLFKEKKKGLKHRLLLSGTNSAQIIITNFFLNHLCLLVFFIGFFSLYRNFNLSSFLLSLCFIELSFITFLIVEKKSENEMLLKTVSIVIGLIFLILGLLIHYFKI